MDLELLLHLRLLDLRLLHRRLLLHRRVVHRRLHVLLHLRSWMGWWGWQHRIVMLCAAPTLQHHVVLLEVEELPTITEKVRRLFLVIDWIDVGV